MFFTKYILLEISHTRNHTGESYFSYDCVYYKQKSVVILEVLKQINLKKVPLKFQREHRAYVSLMGRPTN